MSDEPPEKRSWTAEEYLAWERLQPGKHEYFQGAVSAMARVTLEHSLVLVGIASELGNALREGPCQVYPMNSSQGCPVLCSTMIRTTPANR